MQTPQDFRRGAVTLANLKGPLRTAHNHVERRLPDLKAIGPVASKLQDNFLAGLDMMTRRSTYLLELQVIEAMKRAVQVEEAEALGQGIGWAVAENPSRLFLQDFSQPGELTGWEQLGIAEGGCDVPPFDGIVQVDPKYAPQFVALARRKFDIATDILRTATDTLSPLGLDLGPCAAINEVMRRYEALAAFVQGVANQVLAKDRLGPIFVPNYPTTGEPTPYERTPLEPKPDDDKEPPLFMTVTPYLKRDRPAGGGTSEVPDGGSLFTPGERLFSPPSGSARQPWRADPDAPTGWTGAARAGGLAPPSGSATPRSRPAPPDDVWSAPSAFARPAGTD